MARQLKEVGFVHLHVHSSYSLLEGALKVADIVKAAAADRQPALALTDTNNLFGALEFSEKAVGNGIQPIAGMQIAVAFEALDPMARGARACRQHRGSGAGRDRLRQPDAVGEPRLFRQRPRRGAVHLRRRARGIRRRADRAHRRAHRSDRCGAARRSPGARRDAAGHAPRAVRREPPLRRDFSATAWRTSAGSRPSCSASPTATGCRSSPPTSRSSASPPITTPMMRCSPSPRDASSRTTAAAS